MKNLIIPPLILMLTGCPGGNPASHPRTVFIYGENLCFSVNKKDVLNYYTIDSSRGKDITTIASSLSKKIKLSYPDNCIKVNWEYGYSYVVYYGLNGNKYVHEFFIDNDGQLTTLGY